MLTIKGVFRNTGMETMQNNTNAARDAGRERQNTKLDAAHALHVLRGFINDGQLGAISAGVRGEERQFFYDKLVEMAGIVSTMHLTGEGKGEDAVVSLHYFMGGADWYISEKDAGADDDEPEDYLTQCFGLADLFGDGGEFGYISLPEILAAGAELDLHFTPRPLSEVRRERRAVV